MNVAAPVRATTEKVEPSRLSARSGLLQRRLRVGASNDPLELEADRVADQVMAGPTHPVINGTPPRFQHFSGHSGGQMDAAPASVDRVIASPGKPLEPALRQDMEQRFGHDFASVRVHADAAAEKSARVVNALAYTVGRDIVFGAGRFAPGTHDGRQLIAHELAHVVQQAKNSPRSDLVQREAAPDDPDPWANLNEVDRAIAQEQFDTAISYSRILAIAQRPQGHKSLRRQEWIDTLHVLAAKIAAVDRGSKMLDIEGEIPAFVASLEHEASKYQKEWVSIEKQYKDQHRWLLSSGVNSIDSEEAAKYLEEIYHQTKQGITFYPTDEDYAELKNVLDQGREIQIGALRGARIRLKQLKQMMDVVADLIRDREDPDKYVPKWQERVVEEAAHLDSRAKDADQASRVATDPLRKEASRGYGLDMAGMRDELLAKQQETLKTKPKPEESTLGKAYDLVHGAVGAVAGIFIEAGKEAVDLIQINMHFVTLGKYTPHFISAMAAAAENGASTGDLLKGMITRMLDTPSRFLQACKDGDWEAIGRETINLYMLADTLKGIPEAVKKLPEAIDKVRELGAKLPELIAKTHESLRILRARSVALALKAEGRLVPRAPVLVELPKLPAAPPLRVVPDHPLDMIHTPPTQPKGTLQSVAPDGSLGTPRAARQPPPNRPVPRNSPVRNDNVSQQQFRQTGTGGARDTAVRADTVGGNQQPGQGGKAISGARRNTPPQAAPGNDGITAASETGSKDTLNQNPDGNAKQGPLHNPKRTPAEQKQYDGAVKKYEDKAGPIRKVKKPTQGHHVASDKSSRFTPEFHKLFDGADMSLQEAANKVSIEGHKNAHGPDYHRPVLDRLRTAVKDHTPHSPAYKQAFRLELGRLKAEVAQPGSYLNRLVTGN